VARDTAVGV